MQKHSIIRDGFTLVELLVVISIIAVLAAIVVPVLSRTQQNARNANCASNMRQDVAMLNAYRSDHGDYPKANYALGAPGWHQVLAEGGYLDTNKPGTAKLIQCPQFAHVRPVPEKLIGQKLSAQYSYWPNSDLLPDPNQPDRNHTIRYARGEAVVLFMDGAGVQGAMNQWGIQNIVGKDEEMRRVLFRHFGKMNLVFTDGHLEAVEWNPRDKKNLLNMPERWGAEPVVN